MMAVDNVHFENFFGACGIWRGNQWVQLYSGAFIDDRFRSDTIKWLNIVRFHIFYSIPYLLSNLSTLSSLLSFTLRSMWS